MIIPLDRFSRWTDDLGLPNQRLSEWMEEITRQVNLSTPIQGSGSPEGVVIASPTQLYMDTAGTASVILYIKQSGVDTDTGWILV